MRCSVADTAALDKLLKLFFGFERPEIAGFRAAVEQFKADLPAMLDALRQMIDLQARGNPGFRATAAQIGSHAEKQTFLKAIYENFYKVYNTNAADRFGVVYTPGEIVRFMIDGADWLCEQHFGKTLIDPEVDILDPATGTGTYICELLEHFRGQPTKLKHKYRHELHANEVAILPYYVANLNIEATFAAITGEYEEFPSLCSV